MNLDDKYELVVGLEVHAQVLTQSKLFCSDSTSFGAPPNSNISPISLAHPGTLPKLNKKAIESAVRLGLAMHCDIEQHNYFARKNYFYPDLPKGYQVTQHTAPICRNGYLTIKTVQSEKNIFLNRIHMEEDAGKSVHNSEDLFSSIDFNRAGVPLLEIVTEPCIHSAQEAYSFLTDLRRLVRWLDVCDGNMEEGSMRCDANISIRLKGESLLGKRVEVKNLNSIRNVRRAIEIEGMRLMLLTENKEPIIQETRSYDADTNTTFSLRSKEDAEDYRYFPEPDLPAFLISNEYLAEAQSLMPVLPEQLFRRFIEEYGISEYDAGIISNDRDDAALYASLIAEGVNYKAAANWLIGPVKSYCNDNDISSSSFPIPASTLASLIELSETGAVSFSNASSKVFNALISDPSSKPIELATSLQLLQEKNSNQVEQWVEQVLEKMPEKVKDFKSGKKGLMGLFAGEVKKLSKGKADMQMVNKLLSETLNK